MNQRSDEALARLAGDGDEAAFAELYNRYYAEVYDYALRMSRDRNVAALVVQASLLRLLRNLREGDQPASVRVQLFAGAHHDVGEQSRRRRDSVLEGEEAFVRADPGGLAGSSPADLPELARIAWQSARELKTSDYELLDLSVRRRLDATAIASILGTRPQSVEDKLARVVDGFESDFAALLLLRRGRRNCLDLDFLIGDQEWSGALRRRIARHLESCDTCRATVEHYPKGAAVLGVLTPAPAPPGWQETILRRLQEAVPSVAPAAAAAAAGPVVEPEEPEQQPEEPDEEAAPEEPVAAPAEEPVAEEAQPAPEEPAPVQPRTPAPAPRAPAPRRPAEEPVLEPAGGGQGLFGGGNARGPLIAVLGGALFALVVIFAALCGAGAFDGGDGGDDGDPTATLTTTGTATASATATTTATGTPTETPTEAPPPTATPVPDTATPLPPTSTPPFTFTPSPPAFTPTSSFTPRPPTSTLVPTAPSPFGLLPNRLPGILAAAGD